MNFFVPTLILRCIQVHNKRSYIQIAPTENDDHDDDDLIYVLTVYREDSL